MPQSKNRKKRIADHHKRLERTRRKLERKRANSFSGSLHGASELEAMKENAKFEYGIATETYFADTLADRSLANGNDEKTSWSGFSNISNLYSWCQNGLASGVASAKDMLFPSRVLRKELEAAQQRMAQLEEELEQVKRAKRRRQSMSCCKDNSANVLDAVQMSVAPPPAPPPPPLPPPPPPSLMSVAKRSSVRIKAMKEKQDKQCQQPVVSLEELNSVRLRRPQERRLSGGTKVKRKKSVDGPGLKRLMCRSNVLRHSGRELRRQSFNMEPRLLKNLRGSLRRVNVERSPGGTPLLPSKDYSGCGEGIGPVLTRALKRKFEAAYPREDLPSHSEKSSYPSPLVSSLITASATPPPPPPPNTADTSMLDAHMSPLSVSVRDV